MRKLVVNTFLTLDGVMQAPGGPGEDDSDGFRYGGWSVNHWDDAMGAKMGEFMGKPFDLVLGRKTYEIFAGYWPHKDESPAKELNDATKYVASRTLSEVEWQNSILLEGEVQDAVAKLKEGDGPELQVHGSGDLLQTLMKHGLIDEFNIWTFPVVLGAGKRLFAGGTLPQGLKVVDTMVASTGVTMARYVPAGEVQIGSFDD